MTVESAAITTVKNAGSVAAIIQGRIAPINQGGSRVRPNITVQRIHGQNVGSNDGPTGLKFATLQFNCYAEGKNAYADAKALGTAVEDVLDGFAGTVGDLNIQSSRLDDDSDLPDPPSEGQATGIAGVALIFVIGYS